MFRRSIRVLVMGALLAHVAPACVGGSDEGDLNPQPLPPKEPSDQRGGEPKSPGSESTAGGDTPVGILDGGTDGEAGAYGDR